MGRAAIARKQSRKNEHATLRRKWRRDGTYEELYRRQNGLCGICGKPPARCKRTGLPLAFDIDHCHTKGEDEQPRGLLHRGCNLRLGRENNPVWLRQAAAYLEQV